MLTYDVVVWSIRRRSGRPKPWELRWRVGEEGHSKRFAPKPQADGRHSQLMEALRRGQQFDEETGLPEQELAALATPTWYEHAKAYALMKWPGAAGKHRASIAESLAVVTPVLVRTTAGQPDPRTLRGALPVGVQSRKARRRRLVAALRDRGSAGGHEEGSRLGRGQLPEGQ